MPDMGLSSAFTTLALGALYVGASSGLIAFNKFLMEEDRFPFAIALVLGHMLVSFVCALTLYLCAPSLFPSLQDPESRKQIDAALILKKFLPLSIFFAGTLVLSNQAYLYCSLAFLQMMKEGNLVLVYTFCVLLSLERFQWRLVGVILFISVSTALTIYGEIRFVWIGFVIQFGSQICETLKLALQNLLLASNGLKFDPMTFVLIMTPLVSAILAVKLVVFQFHDHVGERFMHWWPYLAVNALLAFFLNVVIAAFIKHSSAVAFILAGIIKDICIVLASTMIFNERVSALQTLGFSLQLLGIFVYSLMKIFPDAFDRGIMAGLADLLARGASDAAKPCFHKGEDEEKSLLKKKEEGKVGA